MIVARRAVLIAAAALLPAGVGACTLVLTEHRSARALARLPLDPAAPALRVAFTHSVLGTPVEDRYIFRHGAAGWRAVLVEERWQGEGYGLPIAASPGETLVRDGAGWRLTRDREVQPLVVRPAGAAHAGARRRPTAASARQPGPAATGVGGDARRRLPR
ncbi:MAG: DUF1850 domain-containing protein [Rubrivivax sp.]|nr:DUF1850 domain-containing protein [Rubrivivax sp.]